MDLLTQLKVQSVPLTSSDALMECFLFGFLLNDIISPPVAEDEVVHSHASPAAICADACSFSSGRVVIN